MKFVLQSAATAIAVWVATLLPLNVDVTGGEAEWWSRVLVYLAIGAVITLLNRILKPVLHVLALPITILTLGLFALVISWFILWVTAWITSNIDVLTLEIGGFWSSLLAALVISIVSTLVGGVIGVNKERI